MFISITAHVGKPIVPCQITIALIRFSAINLYRMLRGYVWLADSVGPTVYWENLSRWDNITHGALNMFTTLVGDCVIVCLSQSAMPATTYMRLVDLQMLHYMGQQPSDCHPAHCHSHRMAWYVYPLI
jgi:hypothetical protein